MRFELNPNRFIFKWVSAGIFLFQINLLGQTSMFFNDCEMLSNVITKKLSDNSTSALKKISFGILPSIVEWRFYPDWNFNREYYKKEDSLYLKLTKNESNYTYGTVPMLESFYAKKLTYEVENLFKNGKQPTIKLTMSREDSLVFINELRRIKYILNSGKVSSINLNDSICLLLKKFSTSHVLVYDLLVCQGNLHSFSRVKDLIWFQRFFVFDLCSKIVYYKYNRKMTYGDATQYWKPVMRDRAENAFLYDKFPRMSTIIKPYIRKLKK